MYRKKVKKGLEIFAQRNHIHSVTTAVFNEAIAGMDRQDSFSKMPSFIKGKQETNPEKLV